MTPEERRQDAVSAVHEWRDAERLTPVAGDKIVVHWPNGPDFHMEFLRTDPFQPPIHEGWLFLYGIVGYTEPNRFFDAMPIYKTLYAKPIGPGEFEMLPKLL